MTNRRQFLQIGLAAGALPLASHNAFATGTEPARMPTGVAAALPGGAEHGTVVLYKAVYDSRFADSVAFAKRARALGLPLQEIEGDITSFWFHELDQRWRRGERAGSPVAIAGLTAHGALFCLERLAWDQRMRVVFRAEHAAAPSGSLEHRLSGPVAMLDASGVGAMGEGWAESMADVLAACPRGLAELSSRCIATSVARAAGAETLYSWVIAPAARG
jgi:hypothetical protein